MSYCYAKITRVTIGYSIRVIQVGAGLGPDITVAGAWALTRAAAARRALRVLNRHRRTAARTAAREAASEVIE
jgi:hypothetical protein